MYILSIECIIDVNASENVTHGQILVQGHVNTLPFHFVGDVKLHCYANFVIDQTIRCRAILKHQRMTDNTYERILW